MRLVLYLLIITTIQVSASDAVAQKINYSGQHVAIRELLSVIEKQTGYLFFYDVTLLNTAKSISVSFDDVTVDEALDQICAAQNFSWVAEKKTITLIAKPTPKLPAKNLSEPQEDPLLQSITGKVTDKEGRPLAGTTILIKGTSSGVLSDSEGNFNLKARINDVLKISFVGYKPVEIALTGKTSYNLVLETDLQDLDEVQVIAYGTTTKRLSTSAISSIKADIIEKQAVINPLQALQGRVAGLSLVQNSGAIGSGMEIQIRGVNSIESGTQPLIIIDGAIVPSQGIVASPTDARSTMSVGGYMLASLGTTSFNSINPEDVESIEVLKDADATAIYGSRGANGVIIITTKKAKLGDTRFSVDASHGINMATYIQPRMNLSQYLEMRKDAFATGLYNPTTGVAINPVTPTTANAPDLLSWSQTASTNWGDYEYGNPANVTKVQTNLSGGTKNISFYISGGYSRQEDITLGSPYQERISGRANISHLSANEKLRVILNTSYSTDKLSPSKGGGISGNGGVVQGLPPNMPLYETDGSMWWPKPEILQNSMLVNPLVVETVNLESVTSSLVSNLDISYKIRKNLTIKGQFGYNNQLNNYSGSSPSTAINPFNPGTNIPTLNYSQNNFQSVNFEPQVNYTGKLFKGKFEAMLGGTLFSRNSKSNGMVIQGYSTDLLLDSWAAGATVTSKSSTKYYYNFVSLFGRLNYNLNSKYLVNLTFRRDGSSRFGPEKQYGNFGAVGLGWVFSNETFLRKNFPVLSYGKLRASYGTTGNDNISEYRFTSLYTATGVYYNGASGLASTYLSDPSIGWETSRKLDLGLEQGYFKDRILLTVNWFRTHTMNMLLNQPVPPTTGFTSFLTNMPGLIENKGWEFDLSTRNLALNSPIQWKTTFNLTLLKNTLLEYPDLASSAQSSRLEIGKPVRSPNLYSSLFERTIKYEGINTATGLPNYKDVDGSGTFNNKDYVYIGSAIPRTYGGLGNTLSYKGFELDIFVQFSQQLTTNNVAMATYAGQLNNPSADWYGNYWKQPGDVTKYPRLYLGVGTNATSPFLSSYYSVSSAGAVDLFYARLKNLQLSYTVPAAVTSKAKLSKVQLYVRGQNLLAWTSKEIFKDPEAALPASMMLKNWTIGLQMSF